ncbi:diguanylate cyclase [Roseomonas terrae]|uniref:diguanylate cyclase n=1 Tax=Neoroseomonas terrae TaxID=424799 RepID=A0ABS5EJE6_9PROT|nr:sensor domain-containing diguanylate cyclase [Neoroseomonas terrae]MBR0651153.1 diguanylate cyclase [Neoroseomonas terrae]
MAAMTMALLHKERSATIPPAAAAATALHGALLESRQRWQDLAGLAADFVFETDSEGRFSFLWPGTVLGHPAAGLLGRRADSLLLGTVGDPFALRQAVRNHRAWVAGAGGRPRCLSLSLAPLGDARGQFAGLRGVAQDVTDQEAAATAAAAGLRRAALLDALGETVRHAGTATEALTHGLVELRDALGCAGTTMVVPAAAGAEIINPTAPVPTELPSVAARSLASAEDWVGQLPGHLPVALFHHHGRPPTVSALAAWRAPGGRDWDAEDLAVLRAMAATLGGVLGFGRVQAELERQAGTDPLTGLANRRAFLAGLAASIGDGAPGGALLFIDLDNLKPLNDRLGHDAGDAALRTAALLLRDAAGCRGAAARLGGDEFTLWLPGAAPVEAIACAESLIAAATALPAGSAAPRFSIGLACREGGAAETAGGLLARADAALYDAKREHRGGWRLAPPAA